MAEDALDAAVSGLRRLFYNNDNNDDNNYDVQESRKSPTLYCQNVDCGAPHGGAYEPLCPDCNTKLKNGGPPILLENGKTITKPPEPEE